MKLISTTLFILLTAFTFAQKLSIEGKVVDANGGEPIIGATVSLLQSTDSLLLAGEITDIDGTFKISDEKKRDFLLRISYIGYETLFRSINSEDDVDLGTLNLYQARQVLDEIVVEAEVVTGEQRGDTVAYNAAAFTTLNDATTQDLLTKMPGIVIQNGQVQAEGETIQRVMVDGKEFFGGDVNTALQSLPAEMIKKIEIYNRKSEKAMLTGFDDGNEEKTINIVTKASKKIGQFGKMTAGYGSRDRYQAAASVNFFKDDQRWTVTGISNNINVTNFTADPNSQGEERTQDGEINTNNVGLQYSNTFFNKLDVSGNYGFSNRRNVADGALIRDYILPSRSDQVYEEFNSTERNDFDHRLNMRVEYRISPRNTLIFLPRIGIKNDINDDRFFGSTSIAGDALNQTTNESQSNNFDNDYSANLLFSHKFLKPGRRLTLSGNTEYHNNEDDANRRAENVFFLENGQETELLNQNITREREGFDIEGGFSYVEPIHQNGKIELEYEFRNRKNDSEKLLFDLFEEPIDPSQRRILETALSNVFNNEYMTNEAELGYQYQNDRFMAQFELQYQRADLNNDQLFPVDEDLNRTFYSLLPDFRLEYQITDNSNFELNYYTWTREPRVGQLQEVIDNTNPLQLRIGNPNLDQEYNNRWRLRYRLRNPSKETSFYAGMRASLVNNQITSTTFIAEETFQVNDDVTLEKGGQLIRPQNIDGNWDIGTFVNFGRPIKVIKSNFNIWTGVGYRQLPGIVNNEKSFTNSTGFRLGLNLSSNISDKVDFNISTRSSYNIVENSLRPQLNNNFFRHYTRVNFNAIVWKGITLRTDINHSYLDGLAEGIDNSFLLVNGSIGKKVMKDDRGEISLRVYDLFQQNNNIDREITEIYIQDSERTVLRRYFMLSFTYNLRHFNSGASLDDFELGDDGRDRRRRRRG